MMKIQVLQMCVCVERERVRESDRGRERERERETTTHTRAGVPLRLSRAAVSPKTPSGPPFPCLDLPSTPPLPPSRRLLADMDVPLFKKEDTFLPKLKDHVKSVIAEQDMDSLTLRKVCVRVDGRYR